MMDDFLEIETRGPVGERRWYRRSAIVGVEPAAPEEAFRQFTVITLVTGARIEIQGRASEIMEKL